MGPTEGRATLAVGFKGAPFPQDIILTCVRWYGASPLGTRHVAELTRERGVPVDHATVHRWVIKSSPPLEEAFHRRKRPVWGSWRMDEPSLQVEGEWRYLYRAADKTGQTLAFPLTEQRDEPAARHSLTKAIRRHGVPDRITIDGSEANAAAIKRDHGAYGTTLVIRRGKYLNNTVGQDHRGVKRVTRPMLGLKSCEAAQSPRLGIALMHMLRQGQLEGGTAEGLRPAEQVDALAS